MESFKSKYPALTALLAIIGGSLAKLAAGGEGWLQKIESEAALAPQVLSFVTSGQAAALSSELGLVKQLVPDMEAGIELLVTDFALSSDKAKLLLPKAFAVAEWAVAGVAPIKDLVVALES
jgi:hypothetical protein